MKWKKRTEWKKNCLLNIPESQCTPCFPVSIFPALPLFVHVCVRVYGCVCVYHQHQDPVLHQCVEISAQTLKTGHTYYVTGSWLICLTTGHKHWESSSTLSSYWVAIQILLLLVTLTLHIWSKTFTRWYFKAFQWCISLFLSRSTTCSTAMCKNTDFKMAQTIKFSS